MTRGLWHPKNDLKYKTSMEKTERTNIKFLLTIRRIKNREKKRNKSKQKDKKKSFTI